MSEESTGKALPKEAQKFVPIREVFEGPLLPSSYTLKLDGSIIDRKTNQQLKAVIGNRGIEVGQKLLVVHPSGGRLKISKNGLIVGFEKDRWVVIGSVSASELFDVR